MTTAAAEQPLDTIPRDGRYVNVRVGSRWFKGFFGVVTGEEEAGERVYAFLGSEEPRPVTAEAWTPRGGQQAVGSRQKPATSPTAHCPLPTASQRPLIALDDVIWRIDRAVLTAKHMHDAEWRFLSAGSRVNWPAYVYDKGDRDAQAENQSNLDADTYRFKPTRADLSDLDRAWEWFRAMNLPERQIAAAIRHGHLPLSPDQKLIWASASGASAAAIARKLGVSDETARRRTDNAYARLHAIADGQLRRQLDDARRRSARSAARRKA